MAFLAVLDLSAPETWEAAKDLKTPRRLLTRRSSGTGGNALGSGFSDGSYDDIRRKDLLHLCMAGIVATDDPTKDQNDGTRRYGLNPEFTEIVRAFGSQGWDNAAREFVAKHGALSERLNRSRNLPTTRVILPSGRCFLSWADDTTAFRRPSSNTSFLDLETEPRFLCWRYGPGSIFLSIENG